MIEAMLLEAVQLAREGRTVEARWLIQEVLRRDRANETAWLLMADCAETREESIMALESCLRHVPDAPRAKVGLELLRSENFKHRGGVLLTDRINLAVKNVKSQPRKLFEGEPVRKALDTEELEKLRHALPEDWVPVTSAEAAETLLDEGEESALDHHLERSHLPRSQRAAAFWEAAAAQEGAGEGKAAPSEPVPPQAVEAFLVPPDLFTPEEITELEEALGEVPLARRRVSLIEDPARGWKSLSDADLPEAHRTARLSTRLNDRLPAGRVLLYALVAGVIVFLAAGLLLLAAFALRGV